MAENETLDLDDCPRWQSVVQSIVRGGRGGGTGGRQQKPDDLAKRFSRSLFETVKAVSEQIPLDQLIVASEWDHERMQRLANECDDGRDYADLFVQVAGQGGDRSRILENFIWAIVERFSDQIVFRTASSEPGRRIHEVQRQLDRVSKQIAPDVRYIVEKFAANPAWVVRKRPSPKSDESPTATILGQSLLGGKAV